MADGMPAIPNFGFMNNPMLMDPGMMAAMNRQQYAMGLLGQSSDASPIRSPWQAVARGLSGVLGGYQLNQAQQQMQDYATGSRQAMADLYRDAPVISAPVPQAPSFQTAPQQTSAGPSSMPPGNTYAGQIMAHEGVGKNPNSTASGYGGFLTSTWNNFAQANPQLFQGMSPDQILAARNDPKMGAAATNWLAAQNATVLTNANVQPTGQSLGIAHYVGARPAAQIMQASDDTPVAGIVGPAAVNANPELRTMTAGQMKARYANMQDPIFIGATSTQPGSGGAAIGTQSTGSPIADAQRASAAYGVQMATQLRDMAARAAQSPYAAVRAMAPQFYQQSVQAAQMGRFQMIGTNQNGSPMIMDRGTGEMHFGPSTETLSDPSTGNIIGKDGRIIAPGGWGPAGTGGPGGPGGTSAPGGPGGAGYTGNPQTASSYGVPTALGNPYSQYPLPKQGELTAQERVDANKQVSATDAQWQQANQRLIDMARLRQLTATDSAHGGVSDLLGDSLIAKGSRINAEQNNYAPLQEAENIIARLVPSEQLGTGVNQVGAQDLEHFKTMAPSLTLSGVAMNNAIAAAERQAQLAMDNNRFQHAYVNANGTTRGMQQAWDSYLTANPSFSQDPRTGAYVMNPNRPDYATWFRANTDPNTGLLRPGSAAPSAYQPGRTPVQPGQPAQPQQQQPPPPTAGPHTVTTTGTALPDPSQYAAGTVIHGDGRVFQQVKGAWKALNQ